LQKDSEFSQIIWTSSSQDSYSRQRLPLIEPRSQKDQDGLLELLTRIAFVTVSIAVVAWISLTMLFPRITNPVQPTILLYQTVELTPNNYYAQFPLGLDRDEKIDIKVSGDGQPIEFTIVDTQSFLPLVDERSDTYYDYQWIVPANGIYAFCVSAQSGDINATIIVTEM
jgi:hypothetical protein